MKAFSAQFESITHIRTCQFDFLSFISFLYVHLNDLSIDFLLNP